MLKFNSFLTSLFDAHAPVKNLIIKESSKPWLTDTVRLMINHRNIAHNKFRQTKSDHDKTQYKTLKILVNSSLFYEKRAFFEQNINNNLNNPKLLWKQIKKDVIPNFKSVSELPHNFRDPSTMNTHFLNVPGSCSTNIALMTYFEHHLFCEEAKFTR